MTQNPKAFILEHCFDLTAARRQQRITSEHNLGMSRNLAEIKRPKSSQETNDIFD